MRAVVDANVFVSAALSSEGAPAGVLLAWQEGRFELVVSPLLLAELERVLAYPKVSRRIPAADATELLEWVERLATVVSDSPEPPPRRSSDPGDDYLLALAAQERAALVSGDAHLLALAEELPVFSPRAFLDFLDAAGE